jgi:hypothetical protein
MTWNPQKLGTRNLYSVSLLDTARGFIAASGGTIFYTSNGGKSWDSLSTSTGNALYGSFVSGVSDTSSVPGVRTVASRGTIVGEGGTILRILFPSVITAVVGEPGASIPSEFALSQNYPNPFNPTTSFELRVPGSEFVALKIFDALGREIATLVNERKTAGIYGVLWDAGNLPSGVYFCRLQVGDASTSSVRGLVQIRKALLLK